MTPDQHLEILRTEGLRLAAMPAEALDAQVPTVPGWTLERVVRHTGRVHRWVQATLAAGPGAGLEETEQPESLPRGPDCLPAYREALEQLLAEIHTHDFGRGAPTFAGPGTVGFWARRQAHEVAVHRMDAADALHAAGGPAPADISAESAADGVDEWARLMLVRALPADRIPQELHGRTVHLHGTDTEDAEWLLRFGPEGVEVEAGHGKGDVAVRGTAQELLLTMWRRRPLAALEVFGDVTVAQRLVDAARI
ncbi:maleylpyruvate isomerase N-terminal domain-containing protein [Rhodococcus sp. NPDC058481]|uniref:maleylpyruvate isomerase N-terminal domain-containing protein n=1 Tax=unclassified Rhodococcus (in: high G+C Gram-positive bacteria) TaxID=192944 RepID=UPI0036539C76